MKIFHKHFLFCIIFIFATLLYSNSAMAESSIYGGVISEDTTWTKDGGPYVIYAPEEGTEAFTVGAGTTLTIEAGTVVKFDYSQPMSVSGRLIINGTADEKVYFTSLYDDSVGGDIDGDEGLIEPYNTDWAGVQVFLGGSTELNNTVISYADSALTYDSSSGQIFNSDIINCQDGINAIFGSTVNIENSNIENILGDAVFVYQNSTSTIKNTIIDNVGGDSLNVYYNSSLNIEDSSIKNITGQVLYMFGDSKTNLVNIDIENSSDGVTFFNNSILNISGTNIDNVAGSPFIEFYNGSQLYLSNSILKNLSGIAIECYGNSWGVYGTTTLDISSSSISDGDNIGLQIFGDMMEANISKSKINNFLSDGVQTFSYPFINISDSEITGNNIGIRSWGANIEIKNSIIYDNINYGISNNPVESGAPSILAINNWWGDKSGPFNEETNASGTANGVTSNVVSTPWLRWDPRISRKTPVIIVPGLLGTELKDDSGILWANLIEMLTDIGDRFLDRLSFNNDLLPINSNIIPVNILKKVVNVDYSDNLTKIIISEGYTEGTSSEATLFTFPYDWRYGVTGGMTNGSTTADLLKTKIQEILEQTGSDKVDIIAHSTGGLIVKKYVIDNQIENHINKAVFVGVPNTGAPKAVKSLLQGDSAGIPWLSSQEMKKLFTNFPVTYDLLPSKQYYDAKGSYVKIINEKFLGETVTTDLNYEETNNYLSYDYSLNSTALTNANNLHTKEFDNFDMRTAGVDLYSINGCKAWTLGTVVEVRHIGYGGVKSVWYKKPIEVPGDNTVPLESSTNLPIDQDNKFYALKADHSQMMSQDGIKEKITNIISGSNLEIKEKLITQDISKCELNGKGISVYSPVDIDVIDQDGNHTGIDIDGNITNDIPNADIQIWDDHKFIFLSTDEGQIYTVNMKGTGVGTYTIESDSIIKGQYVKKERFSNLPVTPELTGNIDISSDTTILLVKSTASSTVEIIRPDVPETPKQITIPNVSSGSSMFIVDTAIRNQIISSTSIKNNNISTSTISKIPIKISKKVVNKKIEKNKVKSDNNQVATVINSEVNTGIINYIKGLIKRVFFFWKK